MLSSKSFSLLTCAVLLTITAGVVHGRNINKTSITMYQHKEVATWEEARQHCEDKGTTLASPINEEWIDSMKAIITANNHTTPYFIGFKARNNSEFRSEEGILLQDVLDAYNMVEEMDPLMGDCLCMDGHNIRIESCFSRLPFICYTTVTFEVNDLINKIPAITPKRQKNEKLHCGPDYEFYSTGCYKLHKVKFSWALAYGKCNAEGSYLAVINDSDEAQVVADLFRNSSERIWVGLRKAKDNKFVAITGEHFNEVYNVWDARQTDYLCASMAISGNLDDYPCGYSYHFVCEK